MSSSLLGGYMVIVGYGEGHMSLEGKLAGREDKRDVELRFLKRRELLQRKRGTEAEGGDCSLLEAKQYFAPGESFSNGGNIFWVLSDCRHYFRLYCVNAWLKLNASCHVSHIFILSLAILFFWSHTPTFINKSPPHIPEVHILGDPFPRAVNALTIEINRSFSMLREIASGRDLKKSLIIIAGLWVLSMDERF
ncbi:hypothetical protein VitviT2T_011228 [Vitis vinifera]|uniref:Reticulon-like protein n=1 Tax=Vitis vinifera TaxID=29760 RepID=A0ABY9CA57_VITVI|nr:reticulon-like protein B2 [Vitis vinifera]WJZ92218.1 hypothetical protein VitviT2T_011228 [Vitis vinifera]|eukprot:XP_010653017.1 PREDICTED: reticulon-like protein B2 [Vitis vinifera]